jgi:hypothetical protein
MKKNGATASLAPARFSSTPRDAEMTANHGFGKTLSLGFDSAIDAVTEALNAEGFGILTDIDVQRSR